MSAKDFLKYLCVSIAALLGVLSTKYSEDTAKDGLRQCTKAVRNIKLQLKTANTIGEKQGLLSSLAQIKSFRNQIKFEQKRVAGITPRKETSKHRVSWGESATAFSGRIRTGVITNLQHTDPKLFLKDCEALFHLRMQNALKKDESFKVNAVFCGLFAITKVDMEIKEFKYINTKNASIYRDTDLEKWFTENIQAPILLELEEFQEKDSCWALEAILNLQVNINKFTPQLGS